MNLVAALDEALDGEARLANPTAGLSGGDASGDAIAASGRRNHEFGKPRGTGRQDGEMQVSLGGLGESGSAGYNSVLFSIG